MQRPQLAGASDTARWVAYLRALESERPDPLFVDPYARELAGPRGKMLGDSLPVGPLRWSLAVSTYCFDTWASDLVSRHHIRSVLNLGCGLDTRPYRMSWPNDVRWVEVDEPELLRAKTQVLQRVQPHCQLARVPMDLSAPERNALLRGLALASPVLVITEGLLVYLAEHEVAALAGDLRDTFEEAFWLVQNISPAQLARQRRKWGKLLAAAGAPHRFAPQAGLDFFAPYGWQVLDRRSTVLEGRRLGREMRFSGLLHLLMAASPGYRRAIMRASELAVLHAPPT